MPKLRKRYICYGENNFSRHPYRIDGWSGYNGLSGKGYIQETKSKEDDDSLRPLHTHMKLLAGGEEMRKIKIFFSITLLLASVVLVGITYTINEPYVRTTGTLIAIDTTMDFGNHYRVEYSVDNKTYFGVRYFSGKEIGDTVTIYYAKNNHSNLQEPSHQFIPFVFIFLIMGVLFSIKSGLFLFLKQSFLQSKGLLFSFIATTALTIFISFYKYDPYSFQFLLFWFIGIQFFIASSILLIVLLRKVSHKNALR
ncbi:MAG: DUF3592 domain-containing protein [Oscillospiraceae bacterium]|jgi:hypothetical protein|nr:DUF3592 domain-containing protein [Oscillospiraceae bacterium]